MKVPEMAAAVSQRETLGDRIAAAEAELAAAENLCGSLALDVALGAAPQTSLDEAIATCERLEGTVTALQGAGKELDRREAEAAEEAAVSEHARLEKELAKAEAEIHTTAEAALDTLNTFAIAAGKLVASERKALNLAGKLGASRRYGAGPELRNATLAALSTDAAPLLAQQPPGSYDRAAARLLALRKVEVV